MKSCKILASPQFLYNVSKLKLNPVKTEFRASEAAAMRLEVRTPTPNPHTW